MYEEEVLTGSLMDDTWLTLEQVAAFCRVESEWLIRHIEEGLFPDTESFGGIWRFSSTSLLRARRMRQVERDFEAVPELAALVADLLEEIDYQRTRQRLRNSG